MATRYVVLVDGVLPSGIVMDQSKTRRSDAVREARRIYRVCPGVAAVRVFDRSKRQVVWEIPRDIWVW